MCIQKFRTFIYGWKTAHNSHFCYLKIRTLKISLDFLMNSKACYTIVFENKLHGSIRATFIRYFFHYMLSMNIRVN